MRFQISQVHIILATERAGTADTSGARFGHNVILLLYITTTLNFGGGTQGNRIHKQFTTLWLCREEAVDHDCTKKTLFAVYAYIYRSQLPGEQNLFRQLTKSKTTHYAQQTKSLDVIFNYNVSPKQTITHCTKIINMNAGLTSFNKSKNWKIY